MAKRTVKDIDEHGEGNPPYDINSAQLAKYRAAANRLGGLRWLDPYDRLAYANAVEAAVLASQRAALAPQREVLFKASCASGTFHNSGIGKAVQQQHRAALAAYPAQVRRARTPREWEDMYKEAMHEKRQQQLKRIEKGLQQCHSEPRS